VSVGALDGKSGLGEKMKYPTKVKEDSFETNPYIFAKWELASTSKTIFFNTEEEMKKAEQEWYSQFDDKNTQQVSR
jgi:hypothetical protein